MIMEKGIAIAFWVGVGILALLGSMYFNVWADVFENEKGHDCYPALSIIGENKTVDYDNAKLYYVCYPTLDERILGEQRYYEGDIPQLTFGEVKLDEGNTQSTFSGSYTRSDNP